MKYLQSLTNHLINVVGINKELLESWVEDGSITSNPSVHDIGFESKYTCMFELSNIDMGSDLLMMHLVNWTGIYNPQRGQQGLADPGFAIESLSNNKYDISIRISFKEQYDLKADPEGRWEVNGVKMSLVCDADDLLDVHNASELLIFDSHTQDTGLKK